MKIILLHLALLVSIIPILDAQPGEPHRYIEQNFDVLEYRPEITIEDPSSTFIRGINTIRIVWKSITNVNSFYYHSKDLDIDSVLYDGKRAIIGKVFDSEGEILYNEFKTTATNPYAEIKIYYSGKMTSEGGNYNWGGVHYSANILYAMGVGFYNDYVSCTRHWLPCYDLPSDKALYTGTFIVPDTLMAISNGKMLSVVDTLGNFKKYTWSLGNAKASTYLLTFAIGKFSKVDIESENVPTTVYMYNNKTSTDAGEYAFKLVPEMIEAFSSYFGYDYPYESMGYYGASKGAMEHQAMVTMSNSQIVSTANAKDSMYSTAAHELGHQWFGDLITPYDFRDAWLNEGFATFTEYIWIESKFGEEKYREEMLKLRSEYLNKTAGQENNIPLYNFSQFTKKNYPSTIYKKGGLIVALIREIVGDEVFKQKINEYLNNYSFGNATTNDLSEIFGQLLPDKFWDMWVYGRGFPQIDIYYYSGEHNDFVIAEQRDNEYQVFDLTLNYSIDYDHGQNKLFSHQINSRKDTLVLPKGLGFAGVEVIDNYYPYKIMGVNRITSVEIDKSGNKVVESDVIGENLVLDFKKNNNYTIEIVTLEGKELLVRSGYYFGKENIDLSTFVAGIYFVYIRSDENSIIRKIMVK